MLFKIVDMNDQIKALKPERLWYYFLEVCKIPRCSKKEEQIIRYLVEFGHTHGLETLTDEVQNVLIRKPATKGNESRKPVVLQSHIDMVCEKNADTKHDFDVDPITPYIDGGWIKARGTTLGADDGIGIAAQLAILESKDVQHGPIECLFTVDEETGLSGAFGLKSDFLKSSVLLNLDSEDEGQLFIGCAGGRDTVATFDLKTSKVQPGSIAYKISLTGLQGGHSGDDINKGLGNAVKLLNRFLWNSSKQVELKVSSIQAGNLRNALAREGFAVVVIPEKNKRTFEEYGREYEQIIKDEYKSTEKNIKFSLVSCDLPGTVLSQELQFSLLNSLYACPHGVIEYSREIPGLVETSTNLASVKISDNKIIVTTSQRSSVESAKQDICDMVASVFGFTGAEVEHSAGYPGWQPDPNSPLVKVTVACYQDLFKQMPQVLAIHAGLECGLIGAQYPGMDMISFGPTIKGAHSPDERLEISTVMKFWDLLIEILKRV